MTTNRPTNEQICAFLGAAIMIGRPFTGAEYEQLADMYADGYRLFGGALGMLDMVWVEKERQHMWRVNEKGLQFLENGGK